MKTNCPNSTEFETRIQSDGRVLYRCTHEACRRVARTKRTHPLPNPATRSHDNTMGILWDGAEQMRDRIADKDFYAELEARFEERLEELVADRDWHSVTEFCGAYETFLALYPQAREAT